MSEWLSFHVRQNWIWSVDYWNTCSQRSILCRRQLVACLHRNISQISQRIFEESGFLNIVEGVWIAHNSTELIFRQTPGHLLCNLDRVLPYHTFNLDLTTYWVHSLSTASDLLISLSEAANTQTKIRRCSPETQPKQVWNPHRLVCSLSTNMSSSSIIVRYAETSEIAWILNCIKARVSEAKLQVAGEGKYRHGWMASKDDLDSAILNHELLVAQENSGTCLDTQGCSPTANASAVCV